MTSAVPSLMTHSPQNHSSAVRPNSPQGKNSQKKTTSATTGNRRVPPPPAGGRQKQFLKTRAQSDLVPLINAGIRLSRQDSNIRRLMTEEAFKNRHNHQSVLSASNTNNNNGKSAASSPLGPIQEQTLFESVLELPDLQGDDALAMMATMRSRSGTNDSAGRRRRKRCVSVSESELIKVLAGGCQSCNSLLSLYGTSKPRVSNITFSTVTSATGLPTIAAEPSRPRSSSYWKPSHTHTIQNHGGHHGGGGSIATNFSNSLPQRINLYEYEDDLLDQQQRHNDDQIATNDMQRKQQQQHFDEVGDEKLQRRRGHQQVNDGGEAKGVQAVLQRLLSCNKEEEEQHKQQQRETGSTTSSSSAKVTTGGAEGHSSPYTSRRTSAVDSDQKLQHRNSGGRAVEGVGFHQQLSFGSGDNTSLSSEATTATTTAPCAQHSQSVDSDDMTGQSTKSGFSSSSTPSHHKKVNDTGCSVGSIDMTKTVENAAAGRGTKTKSPRRRPIGGKGDECCSGSSEQQQSQPSSAFGTTVISSGERHSGAPTVYKAVNGTIFDRAELERDPMLQQVQEWSFPIFQLAEKHKRTVLSRLTYAIFKEANLFRTFKISYTKFFNFFHALESGYWDIPYHNRIHAADVLHGTYYLTCHPVHAFCSYHSSELEDEDELEEEEENEGEQQLNDADSMTIALPSSVEQPPLTNHHLDHNNSQQNPSAKSTNGADGRNRTVRHQHSTNKHHFGNHSQHQQQTFDSSAALPLAQSMSPLELMALYTAAAMHDYDHPGRTNAFLVASEDRKAILYNDRSVLENHHAAESWRLLNSHAQFQFIENLDSAETKRFRYLVLEYILATDLKQHFDIIMQFNERVPDMDLSNETDRVLISLMLIKFADINSPAKPYSLHKQWTERICQEFYEQGDEEKKRQMPISPYMDRNEPAVAKLQDSFIAHIVNPLAIALNEAGLFPVLPGLPESELIINLKHNHQKWLHQIEVEQHQQEKEGSAVSSTASTTGSSGGEVRHRTHSNNFGAGGEAEMAMNNSSNSNGGVKLPLFNNCSSSCSASSPSMLAKKKGDGKSCGASAAQRGGRSVTIAATPAATPDDDNTDNSSRTGDSTVVTRAK